MVRKLIAFLSILFLIYSTGASVEINLILASCVMYLIYISLYRNGRVFFNFLILITISIYSVFLLIGLNNIDIHLDLKYHLYWLYAVVLYGSLKDDFSLREIMKIMFIINVIIAINYIINRIGLIHNIHDHNQNDWLEEYRTLGPTLIPFILFPFFYVVSNKIKPDLKFLTNLALGSTAILLNGSRKLFVIFIILNFIAYFNFKPSSILKVAGLAIVSFIIFRFLFLPNISAKYVDKLALATNPMNAPTVLTRIYDINYMLDRTTNNWKRILFGYGIGIKSNIRRINPVTKELGKTRTFTEIDNGFFYVYHRSGIIGLSIFFIFNMMSIYFSPYFKTKLMFFLFFIFLNLLSIQYITHTASAFILMLILTSTNTRFIYKRAL